MTSRDFNEFIRNLELDVSLQDIEQVPFSAWYGHAPFLKFLVRTQKPTLFVELGTHFGFSYFVACEEIQNSNLRCNTYAVDTWKGDNHSGEFDSNVFDYVKVNNFKYTKFSTLLKMTFDEALDVIRDNSIDLLHIDGLHTYEAVKHDFETWLPKMSDYGIIIFHDINVHWNDFGVYKFWKHLKTQYPSFEFNHSYGLGIITLNPSKQNYPLNILHKLDVDQRNDFVGAIGVHVAGFLGKFPQYMMITYETISERDHALAERDHALAERDHALAERDHALAERDHIQNSRIWRFFKLYRSFRNFFSGNRR